MGSHVLLVGDATNSDDVARLMNGNTADLVFTDPPYNVDYEGYTEDRLTIQGDRMTDEQFGNFLATAFKNYRRIMKLGASRSSPLIPQMFSFSSWIIAAPPPLCRWPPPPPTPLLKLFVNVSSVFPPASCTSTENGVAVFTTTFISGEMKVWTATLFSTRTLSVPTG